MGYFQAGYFDGESSRKYTVRVFVDELNDRIAIEHEVSGNEYWPLKEIIVHQTGNHTEIKHRLQPGKSLQVTDADFRREMRKTLDEKKYSGWYHRLINAGTAVHIVLAFAILALITTIYLWVLPVVAEKAVEILPESYDESMGISFFENFIQFETVDSAKTHLVRQFASEMDFDTERKLSFTVVKSKEENAFALPDGNIVIYTGILEEMHSYEELAALMSHESAHVENRHSMKLLCRNLAGYLFLSVVLSDVNGIMAVIADNANTLRSLSYSRNFERQADMDGLNTMVRNNIDPDGMLRLFEMLKKNHKSDLPGFISSHPLTDDRMRYIREKISSLPAKSENKEKMKEIFQLLN